MPCRKCFLVSKENVIFIVNLISILENVRQQLLKERNSFTPLV